VSGDITEERLRQAYERMLADRARRQPPVAIERLAALVRGDGPEEDRLRTLNSVMGDEGQRADFELLRATTVAAEAEAGFARSWLSSPSLRAAAALVVAIGLGTMWWQTRGGPEASRGSEVEVLLVAPEDGAEVEAPPTFRWRSVPETRSYRLQVLTTEGEVALDETLVDTLFAAPDELEWRSVEHLWWVTADVEGGQEVSARPRRFRIRATVP
jgi:hypothetical protein